MIAKRLENSNMKNTIADLTYKLEKMSVSF